MGNDGADVNAQETPTWNQTQYSYFQKVMDEFQQFDNTAGFFVGNEVLTTGKITFQTKRENTR